MRRHRASLDALEAEIKQTRRRITELLGRADRDFAFRPGLNLLMRRHGKATPENETAGKAAALHLVAPLAGAIAFAIGLVAAQRFRRTRGADRKAGGPAEPT